jgi:5-methyltetrahydropteroyltriglutamate--homocysteine methyltransferase
VLHVVEEQVKAGIDIGNDGEQQRVGFQTYVPQRMSGFAGESKRRRGRDYEEFPELVDDLQRRFPKRSRMQNAPEAQNELHYLNLAPIAREIERLKTAVKTAPGFPIASSPRPRPASSRPRCSTRITTPTSLI